MARMTEAEIEDELSQVAAARLTIMANQSVSWSHQGRQVVLSGPSGLAHLDAHEQYLERKLARLQAGGGMTIGYGVIIR